MAFKVKVTAKSQNASVYLKHFVTKLGIVVHHHELECHTKRLVCYFRGQGHSKGSYDEHIKGFT